MDPFVLADMATQYVIDAEDIPFSATGIYEHMSPLSFPDTIIEGVAAPSVPVEQNVVYTAYHDLWVQYTPVCGLAHWLAMFQALDMVFPRFWNCSWETFHRRMATVSTTYDQMQHAFIPMIIPIAPYDRAEFRGVNYQEYYGQLNLSPAEFLRHVLQMVLFGFPVTQSVIQALRLQDILTPYLQTRLAQGDFDSYLRSHVPATSVFDPGARFKPSTTQLRRLMKIGSIVTPMMENKVYPHAKLQELHSVIADVDHMGPLTDAVTTLARQRLLLYGNQKYARYLRRRRGRNTYAMGLSKFNRFLGMGYSQIPEKESGPLRDHYAAQAIPPPAAGGAVAGAAGGAAGAPPGNPPNLPGPARSPAASHASSEVLELMDLTQVPDWNLADIVSSDPFA